LWLKTEVWAFVNTAMNLWVSKTETQFSLKLSIAHINYVQLKTNKLWTGSNVIMILTR